ncbi:MerR family transcriptional regulator [Lactobacillus sp. PV034]|uniref:MerR family transcriptional regulator n=1 Tax=Lactobacillus sp. PV034 TaxID=2594495 RepID=UPI00223FD661|nr:MerR family transcriptional regulator [Lactobacillus sp. PV034]QNQ81300.1 MerR family transcriptional regulator [Lactobacillus sp. PV034]
MNSIWRNIYRDLKVGIGEVSSLTGVTQRQLRYWEEKGYISPIEKDGIRKYSLGTLFCIVFIKEKLDQGYTLASAVKKSKENQKKIKLLRKLLDDPDYQVEITDPDHEYGKINLGILELIDGRKGDLTAIINEEGTHYEFDEN